LGNFVKTCNRFLLCQDGGMKRPEIYLIESQDRQNLAETFMRFQEFYESPVFAGKHFSVAEFASWYAMEYGSFSYARDWSGFNIPSWVMDPFKNGNFDPLTEKEKKLLEILKGTSNKDYIIGVTPQDEWYKDTIKHEFVHGCFFTNPEYRKTVDNFIKGQNPEAIKKALSLMGYGKDVLNDETNAYLLTEPQTLGYYVSLGDGVKLRDKLDYIFQKYFGFSMVKTSVDTLIKRVERFSI